MPGTPIVYYGDEIGMGDNIFLGDRNGVRTPMQWSPDRNGGFSRADPERLYLPPIMDPIYGYEAVNVEAQLRQPSSLLNWMRRLIAARKRASGVRPRRAHLPLPAQPQGARLPAQRRRRDDPVRRQPVARRRRRSSSTCRRMQGPGAGRAAGAQRLPADRRRCRTSSPCRATASTGSCSPRRPKRRIGTSPTSSRCRNSAPWC